MNEFILVTYILSLTALATAVYAIVEIKSLKQSNRHQSKSRARQPEKIKIERSKGHWD